MNIIWLHTIQRIGGVEEFVFQIAKNYPYETIIYYDHGSHEQIERLKKYCRVKKWHGERVKCDTFISNYEISMVDYVDAKEYIQVIHASYITQKLEPQLHPKFKYVAVSKNARDEFAKLTGEKVELCYNPLELSEEETTPCVLIGSFTRLSKEKGGDIIRKLVHELDKEVRYLWFIYSDSSFDIDSPNVIIRSPKVGITNEMASMDIIAQTSYSEGYSYTINQAKSMGKNILYTPCPCFFEMSLDEGDIRVEFDLSNIKEVVEKIKNYKKPLKTRVINESRWGELLNKQPSTYEGVKIMKVKCKENFFDILEKKSREIGEEFEVDEDRYEKLLGLKLVEEVKDATREEEVVRTTKKATRKTK